MAVVIFINVIVSSNWNSSKKLIHGELNRKIVRQKTKVSEQLKLVCGLKHKYFLHIEFNIAYRFNIACRILSSSQQMRSSKLNREAGAEHQCVRAEF